jgi:hypothetical protein
MLVRNAIKIADGTQRFVLGSATLNVEVPIHIEVLVATNAGYSLWLPPDEARDFVKRRCRVHHLEPPLYPAYRRQGFE